MSGILTGHVLAKLAEMEPESVSCVVTSPPYWSLRKYDAPDVVWGGAAGCEHEWGDESTSGHRQRNGAPGGLHEGRETNKLADNVTLHPSTGATCARCGAWRGQFGLEPTPDCGMTSSTGYVLRDDLSSEERAFVLQELTRRGIM